MTTKSTTPTLLRGITWDHPRGYDCLCAADAARPADFSFQVKWDKRSLKDFGDASLSELVRDYDLLIIDHPHAGEAAASGHVLPFDSLLQPDALDDLAAHSTGPSFESYHYAGHPWALPIDAACQVASHRPDVFSADALPVDWDQFFDLVEDLRRSGRRCAMALCPTDALCSFLTLAAQCGDAPDESGRWVAQSTFEHVVEHLSRLARVCVPESLEWNPIRLYQAMATDTSATLVYAPLAFGYTNYARAGYRPYRLAYGGIPGRTDALLGGAGIAISAHCPVPAQASAYALWLCQSACQRGAYVQGGGQPANLSAWQHPEANALCGGFFTSTLDTIRHAYRRPRFPGWPEFQEALGESVHACLRDPINLGKAWRGLQTHHSSLSQTSLKQSR